MSHVCKISEVPALVFQKRYPYALFICEICESPKKTIPIDSLPEDEMEFLFALIREFRNKREEGAA